MNVSLLFRGVHCSLPRAALGWDTGTVEILAPIQLTLTPTPEDTPSQVEARKLTAKLVISTTDSSETLPATPSANDANADVVWDFSQDQLRLPVYSRYATSLTFEIGGGSGLMGKKNPQAMAALWLKDLVDNEEQDIEIPVVVGKDLRQLRQNVIYELEGDLSPRVKLHPYASKSHDFQIVGHIRTRIRLDRGLDEVSISSYDDWALLNLVQDHESHAKTQARRHAFET